MIHDSILDVSCLQSKVSLNFKHLETKKKCERKICRCSGAICQAHHLESLRCTRRGIDARKNGRCHVAR